MILKVNLSFYVHVCTCENRVIGMLRQMGVVHIINHKWNVLCLFAEVKPTKDQGRGFIGYPKGRNRNYCKDLVMPVL